jgi:basic amino acid/polyamine antiporter, APA family
MTSVSVGEPPSAPKAGGELFIRKSSGLVREIGLRDALSVAAGGVSPYVNVVVFYIYLAFVSNADLTLPLIVGAVLLVPLTLSYAQLVAAMPRSGGDYVYASRLIHPLVGAFVGMGFMLLWFYIAAGQAALIATLLLPEFFLTIGHATGAHWFTTAASTIAAHHWWQFAITAVVIVITSSILVRGGRAVGRAAWWLLVAGLIGVIFLVANTLTHSTAAFVTAYNHVTGPNAYSSVIAGAQHNGIATGSTFSGFTQMLPYTVLLYLGFTMSNLPAGEMKRPSKTYIRATAISLGLTGGIMIVGWLALRSMAGLNFLQSASGLSQGFPTAWAHATGGAPFTTVYYAEIVGSPVVRIVIAAGFMLGTLFNPIAVTFVASRIMFALSFDRILPTKLADVQERSHLPVNATVVSAVVLMLFGALTIFSAGFVSWARNSLLMALFVLIMASVSGTILPFRRRDLYESSPRVLRGSVGAVPVTSIVAGLSVVILCWLFYVAATHTTLSGGYSVSSVGTLVGVGVAGMVAYVVSRTYLRRVKGVNIELAMKELPPE